MFHTILKDKNKSSPHLFCPKLKQDITAKILVQSIRLFEIRSSGVSIRITQVMRHGITKLYSHALPKLFPDHILFLLFLHADSKPENNLLAPH